MKKFTLNRWASYFAGLFALAGSMAPLHAATAACTSTGLSFTTMNTDGGCYTTDQLFSNFAISTGTGSDGHYPAGTGEVDMQSTGGGYMGGSAINQINENFVPAGGTAFEETAGASASGGFTYVAAVDSDTTTNPDYQTPYSGLHWVISYVFVSMNTYLQDGLDAGNSITVTEQFCLGQATITMGCTGGSIYESEVGGNPGTITFGVGTMTPGLGTFSTQSDDFVFNPDFLYQEIAIQDIVSITRDSGTIEAYSIQNDFGGEAIEPEPSTFILLGAALAVIGMVRARSRADLT